MKIIFTPKPKERGPKPPRRKMFIKTDTIVEHDGELWQLRRTMGASMDSYRDWVRYTPSRTSPPEVVAWAEANEKELWFDA